MINLNAKKIGGMIFIGLLVILIPNLFFGAYPEFTYQGKLMDEGKPANGSYNFQFRLYDYLTTGTLQGSTIYVNSLEVKNGLFNVNLNFGDAVFTGKDLYLQIGLYKPVLIKGKESKDIAYDPYIKLSPRQPISVSPYALYSYKTAAHSHWGESWSGSGTGLALSSSDDSGLYVESKGEDIPGAVIRNNFGTGTRDGYGLIGLSGPGVSDDLMSLVYMHAGGGFSGPNGVIGISNYAAYDGYGVTGITESTTTGRGVFGLANAATGGSAGIYGRSLSANGIGGYFENKDSGVDIKAGGSGKIASVAETWIYVNPFSVEKFSTNDVSFVFASGNVAIVPGAIDSYIVYFPVDVPAIQYGVQYKFAEVVISYDCAVATSYITTIYARAITNTGGATALFSDYTDRTSTSWETITLTDPTLNDITGPFYIALEFTFAGTGSANEIRIGAIKVKLVQQ